jgi:hypothetical protein
MTLVTTPGSETIDKCGALTSVTSTLALDEPGLGSAADGKGEKGIDRSFERAGTLMYLGE